MGAFDTVPNIVLPDPDKPEEAAAFRAKWRWEAHEQILLKGQWTAADMEAAGNISSGFSGQQETEMRMGSARLVLLDRMIVDWTLMSGGRPVKKSSEMVRRLPSNYTLPILEICDRIATGMSQEAQDAFLDSANGHTTENSDVTNFSLSPF